MFAQDKVGYTVTPKHLNVPTQKVPSSELCFSRYNQKSIKLYSKGPEVIVKEWFTYGQDSKITKQI